MSAFVHSGAGVDTGTRWGACERTVLACLLARRVPGAGLRLLQRAVEAALRARPEHERRDPRDDEALLAELLALDAAADGDEAMVPRLVTLLALVRGEEALDPALTCAPAPAPLCRLLLDHLLRDAPDNGPATLASAPAPPPPPPPPPPPADQRTLTQWLNYLESDLSGNRSTETVWQRSDNIWSVGGFRRTIGRNVEFRGLDPADPPAPPPSSDPLQESFSRNGRDVELSLDEEGLGFEAAIAQPKAQRSNSLTVGTGTGTGTGTGSSPAPSPVEPASAAHKPRSFSLSSERGAAPAGLAALLRAAAARSEPRLDAPPDRAHAHAHTHAHPGMSTVALWLKSLRLHKYVWLFTNITYDEMMAIDDKYLEKLGVTKGARHKILVSIEKLSERAAVLQSVCAELRPGAAPCVVARALERLRAVLLSPMRPGGALADAVLRALRLASNCVTSLPPPQPQPQPPAPAQTLTQTQLTHTHAHAAAADSPAVDPLSLHCWLIERALHHESFSGAEQQAALRALRHRLPPRQFYRHVCDLPLPLPLPLRLHLPLVYNHNHNHNHNNHHRHTFKPKWRAGGGSGTGGGGAARAPAPPARPKSHSYPPFPPAAALPRPRPRPRPRAHSDCDEYCDSLDRLCLQMTEQAID